MRSGMTKQDKTISVRHLNKDDFESTISGDKPVLVDFSASWCGPCQMMAPVLDDLAKDEQEKRFIVGKIDIDQAPEIAAKYDVMSVPSFLIFKEGKEISRIVGAMPKEMLVSKVLEATK